MSANIFSPLPRALALGGVALFGSVGLASTAASAAGGAYYRAELSAPAPKAPPCASTSNATSLRGVGSTSRWQACWPISPPPRTPSPGSPATPAGPRPTW